MTNKKLIDRCNSFWGKKGYCSDCPYNHTYCASFIDKTGLVTPYRENEIHPEVYTDEEIEYED